jgi:hypothetical protein
LTDIMNSGKIETSPDNQIKDYGAKGVKVEDL